MSKTVKTAPKATIVLKSILDVIAKESKIELDGKKVRAKLRATPSMREIHVHNASWIFTEAQASAVRAMFDPKYAAKIAKPAKAKAVKKVTAEKAPPAETPKEETPKPIAPEPRVIATGLEQPAAH